MTSAAVDRPPLRERMLPQRGEARRMAWAVFTDTLGLGLWAPAAVLYFTRVVGLHPAQVAVGLTVAGVAGMFGGPIVGRLADRYGAREVGIAVYVVQGGTTLTLLVVRSMAAFVAVAAVLALTACAVRGARGALIAQVGGDDRVQLRVHLQALANAAFAIGAACAGLVFYLDTRAAYLALILVVAGCYATAAVLTLCLAHIPPAPAPAAEPNDGPPRSAGVLKDRPFLLFSLIAGLNDATNVILDVALPIWVGTHTSAPRWCLAVLLLINCGMAVTLQVRAARGVQTLRSGGRAMARAGLALMAGCLLLGTATAVPALPAVLLMVAGTIALTTGELWAVAGEIAIGLGAAPEHAHGQYQGMMAMISAAVAAAAPALLILMCESGGLYGWLGLGVVFALGGAAMRPLTRHW